MDLLTVVEHEFGHLLGRKDTLDPSQAADIMFGLLDPGVRRTLNRSAVDSLLGDPDSLAEML